MRALEFLGSSELPMVLALAFADGPGGVMALLSLLCALGDVETNALSD
jgi:hypothetical protein